MQKTLIFILFPLSIFAQTTGNVRSEPVLPVERDLLPQGRGYCPVITYDSVRVAPLDVSGLSLQWTATPQTRFITGTSTGELHIGDFGQMSYDTVIRFEPSTVIETHEILNLNSGLAVGRCMTWATGTGAETDWRGTEVTVSYDISTNVVFRLRPIRGTMSFGSWVSMGTVPVKLSWGTEDYALHKTQDYWYYWDGRWWSNEDYGKGKTGWNARCSMYYFNDGRTKVIRVMNLDLPQTRFNRIANIVEEGGYYDRLDRYYSQPEETHRNHTQHTSFVVSGEGLDIISFKKMLLRVILNSRQ